MINFSPAIVSDIEPILIAGPCSAESEEQLRAIAMGLNPLTPQLFRAGVWKPRTRPGEFEGMGEQALPWLSNIKKEFDLKITIEVATSYHVEKALEYDIDTVWIGARSTANPFTVQEIANALRGTEIPVLIKNPIHPDINLWQGAFERLERVGVKKISAIHRGFTSYGSSKYRNPPEWHIPLELAARLPGLQIICDVSHIAGNRDVIFNTAQIALNLNFDGLMVETHHHPEQAWSDSNQQITPQTLQQMLSQWKVRKPTTDNVMIRESLETLRKKIDQLDSELVDILGARMKLAEEIGWLKLEDNISVFQPRRWKQVIAMARRNANIHDLGDDFIKVIFDAIHSESVLKQSKVMNIPLEDIINHKDKEDHA